MSSTLLTKLCSKCKKDNLFDQFNKDSSARDGLQRWCKSCRREYYKQKAEHIKEYREKNAERIREYDKKYYQTRGKEYAYKSLYGLPHGGYAKMHAAQNGRCKICKLTETAHSGRLKTLQVDHDHKTGAVRGLLCGPCNRMLGDSKDSKETLAQAIVYIEESEGLDNG